MIFKSILTQVFINILYYYFYLVVFLLTCVTFFILVLIIPFIDSISYKYIINFFIFKSNDLHYHYRTIRKTI